MSFMLASDSLRRIDILNMINIKFKTTSHRFDEESVKFSGDPGEYCKLISRGKALSIASKFDRFTVLAADTIVYAENQILEKPVNRQDAFRMLSILNDNLHEVYTGVAIINNKLGVDFSFCEKTSVSFDRISDSEIYFYIDNYRPFDKSGAYGIQDYSSVFVKKIQGCYFNVVGLPASRLFFYLKKFKLIQFPLNTYN